GEENQSGFGQSCVAKRGEDLPYAPIDLLDHITVKSPRALAQESLAGMERNVRERVREVEKERLRSRGGGMVSDEGKGLACVAQRERFLLGRLFDDSFVAEEGDRRMSGFLHIHVVAVGNAEIMIEAMPSGQIRR